MGVAGDHPSLRDRLSRLASSGATEVLASGLYAWAVTVAAPAAARSSPVAARVTALVAFVAVVTGPLVAPDHPRAGRAIGIWGLLAASVATWLLASAALAPAMLDPWQGALGALGWAVFAFGWGAVERAEPTPARSEPAPLPRSLSPRAKLPRGAMALVSVAVAGSLVTVALAWRVPEAHRALFAHAAATAAGVATVVSAGIVGVARSRGPHAPRVPPPATRLSTAASALLVAMGLALFGAAYAWLR